MRKLIPISEAAKLLGVHADTLRRWEREGKIKPRRTSGNLRRYDIADIRPDLIHAAPTASRKTVAYARVSSHDQKEDLKRQKQVLESYCAAQGWAFELVADLGSGMNYRKQGLQKLLNQTNKRPTSRGLLAWRGSPIIGRWPNSVANTKKAASRQR
jgi:putative resolvase